jgi:hypothetical protein
MAEPRTKVPSLTRTLVATWRTLSQDLFDTYRPEQHYMRGPGPKWRAKHAPAALNRADPAMAASMTPAHA